MRAALLLGLSALFLGAAGDNDTNGTNGTSGTSGSSGAGDMNATETATKTTTDTATVTSTSTVDPNATSTTTTTRTYTRGYETYCVRTTDDYIWSAMPASRIYVQDQTGFSLGDDITITDGVNTEHTTIIAFGSLVVQPPLANVYGVGATVFVTNAAPASASVGNDPVAWFGKESREFWLPVGKLTPVIQTRHLNMLASTFVGSPREQWIDRIVVTNADGFRLADVRIKKNIAAFNRSNSLPNAFETLDVSLGMTRTPLREIPNDPRGDLQKHFHRLDVWVVVEKLSKVFKQYPYHVDQMYIGKAHREAVMITSPDARFMIISTPATEYYGAFKHLSIKYAHLDIHILDMKSRSSIRGLLPELWGFRKMSNRTKQLTCPPWSRDADSLDSQGVDVDADWNQNFISI